MKGNNKMSFGTAMFAMKDMQNMYQSFDQPKQIIKKQNNTLKNKNEKNQAIKPEIKKQSIKNSQPKPNIILKIPVNNNNYKPIINNQTKPNVNKNQPEKQQFNNHINQLKLSKKQKQLNCLEVNKDIFQLTINKTSTKWKTYKLNQQNGLRAQQIVQNPIINFQIDGRTILQGNLGNCYFICSLGALTQNIQILKKRIIDYQKYDNKSKIFKVNMFQSGKYIQLNVQNSFKNTLTKPIFNDITSLVIQKAYAQLYGNYEAITMGHAIDSMRDLTGQLAEYIDLKDKKKLIKQMVQSFQNNQPLVIASKANPLNQSISAKHSYNVLSYSLKDNTLYLQLRDPRGWTKADFIVNKQLKCQSENGQFYIKYEDLINNFQVITVSRYLPKSLYYYKTFASKQLNQFGEGVIQFQTNQSTYSNISIHQKHKKFFDEKYQYNVVNLMICEINNQLQPIKCIKTNFNSQQVCSISLTLQKGKYIIIGQIYPLKTNKQAFPEQKITLSINTTKQLFNFSLIQNYNTNKSLILYIQQNKHEFKQLITKQNLIRYHGSLFGKMCILYQNLSGKQVIQQLQFQSQNIQIKQKKIKISKNQTKLITYPIGSKNNCSHKCSFKSKTFYMK